VGVRPHPPEQYEKPLRHGAKAHVEYITDTKRRTIFDLPGEIRNKIYGYVLVCDKPIVSRYGQPTSPQMRQPPPLQDLMPLMPLSQVIATDRYETMCDYILHDYQSWLEHGQHVRLSGRTVIICTALPALQVVELEISMPRAGQSSFKVGLYSHRHQQWVSHVEVSLKVEQAVSEKLRGLFQHKNHIKTQVSIAQ
jgi:hypothetical protein